MKRLFFFFLVGTILLARFDLNRIYPARATLKYILFMKYPSFKFFQVGSHLTVTSLSLSLSLSLSCLSVASTTKEIWSRPSLFLWRRWNRRKSQRLPRSPYPWSLPCRNLGSCRKSQSRKSQSFPRSPWILPCPVGVRNY